MVQRYYTAAENEANGLTPLQRTKVPAVEAVQEYYRQIKAYTAAKPSEFQCTSTTIRRRLRIPATRQVLRSGVGEVHRGLPDPVRVVSVKTLRDRDQLLRRKGRSVVPADGHSDIKFL